MLLFVCLVVAGSLPKEAVRGRGSEGEMSLSSLGLGGGREGGSSVWVGCLRARVFVADLVLTGGKGV